MSFGHGWAQITPLIYISRNSKWVLDGMSPARSPSSTSVEIRNEFWTCRVDDLDIPSTSVEIRNEFWTLIIGVIRFFIYISRNSKWVLDSPSPRDWRYIYISRNSKWVLDTVCLCDGLLQSTSVEIRNEFWTWPSLQRARQIYISRNSKWVLDERQGDMQLHDLHQ